MVKRLILLCAVLLCYAAPAFAKFDPSFTWTTLETPHFLIHHHQGAGDIAQRVAVLAEDVHTRLVPRITWEPAQKTHVVLVDSMDDVNGLSYAIPFNRIVLYLTRPSGEIGLGTTGYDDWLRMLITHEYTHTLQIDMITGVPDVLQHIFGRIYFPNLHQPIWMIEGLATYEETEQTAGGRGRSPGSEMVLRMAVLEDRFPSLSQMTTVSDSWPQGRVPYLFGESFTRFLADKYGRGSLADISRSYSGRGVPFLVESTARTVLGREYPALWEEWQAGLVARFQRVRTDVSARGLTASRALTRRGYLNISPAFSPDSTRIAYSVADADGFPGIHVMNSDSTGDRTVVENVSPASASGTGVSWSPDGNRIYYTKHEYSGSTNVYNDLYYFDLKKNREVRITRGLRARDPHPSPDGRMLVFVMNRLGRTRVAALEVPKHEGRLIAEKDIAYLGDESENQYETPRFSPDQGRILVSVVLPNGNTGIWLLDGLGRKTDELVFDHSRNGAAAWSPDGRTVYFSSDRSGIFNLYAYDLASRNIMQVTNVLGGAFSPAISPDHGTIAFSAYTAAGLDIHTLPVNTASWIPAHPVRNPVPALAYAEKPVSATSRPYSSRTTVYPHFWLPWYGYGKESGSLYGFLTLGQDALERHSYFLTALYGPQHQRTWYSLNYKYDGMYPTIGFEARDADKTYPDLLADPAGIRSYTEKERTLGASVTFPFLKMRAQQALTIGYRRTEVQQLTPAAPWPWYHGPIPTQGTLASARARYRFTSAQRYGNSISPEDGRALLLEHEQFNSSFGGNCDLSKTTAEWREYLGLFGTHHVLQTRLFGGTSSGDAIAQRAFQLGGDDPGDTLLPLDEDTVYLRGYPSNAFRGKKAGLAGIEYRFPVRSIETGWGSKPLYFRRIHGAVFAEAGNAWDSTFVKADLKRSIGAEGRLDMYLAYALPITFRLVATRGLDTRGESLVYLGIWMPVVF